MHNNASNPRSTPYDPIRAYSSVSSSRITCKEIDSEVVRVRLRSFQRIRSSDVKCEIMKEHTVIEDEAHPRGRRACGSSVKALSAHQPEQPKHG